MVNRTPVFPLQYFLIILCSGLVCPLTSGGFNLDAIEGIFDSRIRCLVFWFNQEFFFHFQWQLMMPKETCMLKYSSDEDYNVIVIKSWFWKKKLWSFPEQKRKKPTSLISAGPDQSFTGGLILVSSPSPSSWQMFRFTGSGFDKIDKKMRSMFYKETELCQIVHGVSLAPAFAKYVTAHGEMAFPLILTNDQCSGSKVDTFLKFR